MKETRETRLWWTDIPDPDVVRAGDTYYMTSTTMHFTPGCPVMRSIIINTLYSGKLFLSRALKKTLSSIRECPYNEPLCSFESLFAFDYVLKRFGLFCYDVAHNYQAD